MCDAAGSGGGGAADARARAAPGLRWPLAAGARHSWRQRTNVK